MGLQLLVLASFKLSGDSAHEGVTKLNIGPGADAWDRLYYGPLLRLLFIWGRTSNAIERKATDNARDKKRDEANLSWPAHEGGFLAVPPQGPAKVSRARFSGLSCSRSKAASSDTHRFSSLSVSVMVCEFWGFMSPFLIYRSCGRGG